ncbi:NADP-dependent oxidoreductase [Streptomyces oryzae]|uniref:NADP-dependent oxidoreductase n=1 Tax=Streptomyces oryzae TaxID=1434886 RepID=A0ABS3XKG5_9ACTN|nr:NADP-dependent oxidoreductase [Streptomyces oryzae]MBO8195818.1 NADP-dependent oxidoreductase [Streptomyces oryzae]
MPFTTHAMAFDRFGAADVLAPREVELPDPGPGQVRIAVRTAAVNPLDCKIRSGAMQELFPLPLPHVPGLEAAGVVESVGPEAGELAVGDEVFGWTLTGSYAGHALAEAGGLARRPHQLGWAEAAAVPTAAGTALRCFRLLALKPGETLLVHAAAGGVGTLALQLAAARGIRVIGTASEPNHAYVRELGAVPVAYGEGLAERVRAVAPQGVDAALDGAGRGGAIEASIELTGGTERVVTMTHPAEAARHGVRFAESEASPDPAGALAEASALHMADGLRLPVHRLYPLAEAAYAMRESEAGHVRGKLVLVVR